MLKAALRSRDTSISSLAAVGGMDEGVNGVAQSSLCGVVTAVGRLKSGAKQALSAASGEKLQTKETSDLKTRIFCQHLKLFRTL
jgi:hypothetical protein